jgi:hypothetical protein
LPQLSHNRAIGTSAQHAGCHLLLLDEMPGEESNHG